MSLVQLADVIIPAVYADYQAEDSPEKTTFVESGIVTKNEFLNQKANVGGRTVELPFWKDLDATQEPNYSDDSEVKGVPNKITSGIQTARLAYLNQGYKAADLVSELAGSNPMQRIRNRFGAYWARQLQRRIVASARGVQASNVLNNGGDMVSDISIEAGLTATAANLYSRAAFVNAAFTMGDRFDGIKAIAVHSMIYKAMIDANDIDFIPDSNGSLLMPTYLGKTVIVDDGMPVVAGATSGFKYTSALFGEGIFGYGEGQPAVPVEVERNASEGLGGGTEVLWERKTWLIHPFGFKFNSAVIAGQSASLTELATAAEWTRVIDRKNTPLAFLVTNG